MISWKWKCQPKSRQMKINLLLVCPTDEVYVRKESERRLERRKQEQENTNKQQSVGT